MLNNEKLFSITDRIEKKIKKINDAFVEISRLYLYNFLL